MISVLIFDSFNDLPFTGRRSLLAESITGRGGYNENPNGRGGYNKQPNGRSGYNEHPTGRGDTINQYCLLLL